MNELPGANPLRVLVVDDCPDTTRSLAILLGLWGHEAREANDGFAALELARSHRPHVILLDLGMPGLDGYEVARRLRDPLSEGRPLLIAVSGYGTAEDRRRCRETGFDHHLVKPADLEELRRLLADAKEGLPAPPPLPLPDAAARAWPAEVAERQLRSLSYQALKNLSCAYHDGVLVLCGRSPSYYLKQVAQAAVSRIAGVRRIENRIQVSAGACAPG